MKISNVTLKDLIDLNKTKSTIKKLASIVINSNDATEVAVWSRVLDNLSKELKKNDKKVVLGESGKGYIGSISLNEVTTSKKVLTNDVPPHLVMAVKSAEQRLSAAKEKVAEWEQSQIKAGKFVTEDKTSLRVSIP